ncbi:hypothetical protein SNE40_017419 [Patella caerulea]|uniref:Uncharacterized protein n=1 Tax=Patella caerulea TaxID=87958 RepID=A0AAN8PE31_PATCE
MESQRDQSSDYSQRLITRAFYQYIQCLHHLANLAEPSTCFKKKENELNRFIRPARSNPEIVNKIHEINAEWSAKIRYELRQHYQEQLYWSLENVADHHYNHTGEQVMDMGHRALAWAKKNYGKRLRQQTIDTSGVSSQCASHPTRVSGITQLNESDQTVASAAITKATPQAPCKIPKAC